MNTRRGGSRASAALLCAAIAACGRSESAGQRAVNADPDAVLASGLTVRQTVEARVSHLKDLGGSFKSARDQASAAHPNPGLLQVATQEVQSAAQDLPGWFPAGTGPETGLQMRAFDQVWTDAAKFSRAAQRFRDAATSLNAAAQRSDLEGVKAQIREVGEACKACHDTYREKKDDD